jgi:hypothetical protein
MKYLLRDRFLFGILLGVLLLILLALGLFFLRQGTTDYVDESTPDGVVQNYVLALQRRDYERAHIYLADTDTKPGLLQFQQVFLSYQEASVARIAVEIGDTTYSQGEQTALVRLTLLHQGSGGLFQDVYRETGAANLILQSGAWRITSIPYPFWSYNWDSP